MYSVPTHIIEKGLGYILVYKKQITIANKQLVAITAGAGSTNNSHKIFEKLKKRNRTHLLDSKSFWF